VKTIAPAAKANVAARRKERRFIVRANHTGRQFGKSNRGLRRNVMAAPGSK
jgi:hypothetical protein